MEKFSEDFRAIIEKKVIELEHRARLDKLSLSGVGIEKIADPEKLEKDGILNNGKSKMKYWTLNGEKFTNLVIKDDSFGKIKAGVNYGKGTLYSTFSTSVKNNFGTNLICNSVIDYRNQIENTKTYLEKVYGVIVNFENSIVNSIEINKTFKIDHSISDYKRPLEVIAWNIPRKKRMNLVQRFDKKTSEGFTTETMVITSKKNYKVKNGKTSKSKQYEELIFYSKTKQIQKLIVLSEEYLRVEIKIVSAAKIRKMLGTNKFYKITDDIINDFFDDEIKKLIIDQYEIWKNKRDKKILKIMKEQRKSDIHNWIVHTLLLLFDEEIQKGVPVMLDIKELLPLIDDLGIDDCKRRYKIRESFKRQAKKRATTFCNDDDTKLYEIIDKLQTVSPQSRQIYPNGDIVVNA